MGAFQADLVLEGGGTKGIGLVGAVCRFQRDVEVQRVAGSSAGGLVAALVAAGFHGDQLRDLMFAFPFPKVPQPDLLDRVPLIGPWLSILWERGVYDTGFVRDEVARLLAARGVRTFGDLMRADKGSALPAVRRSRLVLTATDLTTGELLYLPWDYPRLGLEPTTQEVADAVAASLAIPFYFEPKYLTDQTGKRHILVDGGVLSNYPITVFDRTDEAPPRWPTFGVKILPRLPESSSSLFPLAGRVPIPGLRQLEALVATLVVGRDQTYLSQPCVARRTIEVDTSGVGVVEFDLSDAQKQHLYDNGWDAADRFLAGWGEDAWRAYLARCRGVIRRERARR